MIDFVSAYPGMITSLLSVLFAIIGALLIFVINNLTKAINDLRQSFAADRIVLNDHEVRLVKGGL